MPKIHLTDLAVEKLKPAETTVEFFDSGFVGGGTLGLRVTPSGRKSWFLFYRIDGRKRRLPLGAYPDKKLKAARKKARGYLGEVADGQDPWLKRKRRRRAATFDELADAYLGEHAAVFKKSAAKDRRMIERFLTPRWGKWPLRDVTRPDVVALLRRVAHKNGTPIQANRLRSLISRMFNFALERDWVTANPAHGTRPPAPERSRDRFLSAKEIEKLWEVLEGERVVVGSLYKMILLTGQRPGEVAAMDRRHIEGDLWAVPAEISKNGRENLVPLSEAAGELLERLSVARSGEGQWVFPSPRGGHIRWFSKATERITKACGFKFSPHDLRRTAASHMGELGVARDIIALVLNHADRSVTGVYDRHHRIAEKRAALERWGARVRRIVTGAPAEVVRMR